MPRVLIFEFRLNLFCCSFLSSMWSLLIFSCSCLSRADSWSEIGIVNLVVLVEKSFTFEMGRGG